MAPAVMKVICVVVFLDLSVLRAWSVVMRMDKLLHLILMLLEPAPTRQVVGQEKERCAVGSLEFNVLRDYNVVMRMGKRPHLILTLLELVLDGPT
jgi:hypothetical protein